MQLTSSNAPSSLHMKLSTRDSIPVPWNLQIARITHGNQARAAKLNTHECLARIVTRTEAQGRIQARYARFNKHVALEHAQNCAQSR
jgi:hypothetical protein